MFEGIFFVLFLNDIIMLFLGLLILWVLGNELKKLIFFMVVRKFCLILRLCYVIFVIWCDINLRVKVINFFVFYKFILLVC